LVEAEPRAGEGDAGRKGDGEGAFRGAVSGGNSGGKTGKPAKPNGLAVVRGVEVHVSPALGAAVAWIRRGRSGEPPVRKEGPGD